MFIASVVKALTANHVRFTLVGGYAVVLHGCVRGTVNIDIVVSLKESELKKAEFALNSIGLQSRIPVTHKDIFLFREEYIKNKNLIAWSFVNPKNALEVVDIIITTDLSELKSINIKSLGLEIPVCSIDDLIKMKTASARPQDLEDVKALKAINK